MKTESSLACSQQPETVPSLEPDETSPQINMLLS